MSDSKILGTVKWFSNRKGYGFITPKSNNSPTTEDIFVHQSSIHCEGYRTLNEGWEVEFEAAPDDSGKLKAQNVTAPGGGPCTGPRPRRERKPREDDGDNEDGDENEQDKHNGGDFNGKRRSKTSNNGSTRNNNTLSNMGTNAGLNNNNNPRQKKPQWHDVLDESTKESLESKNIRTTTGTMDVAMGHARVKLGTGGYASLAHATGLLAEGTFTCDEHGLVNLEWQRALQAGPEGHWNPTAVDGNGFLITSFKLTDDLVGAVGNDETPRSLWGDDKADPKESLEANGFQMRRVVLTRISGGPGSGGRPRGGMGGGGGGGGGPRFRRSGGGSGQPRSRRPPAAAAASTAK